MIFCLLLVSCNHGQARIELLKEELKTELPDTYEQIGNITEGFVDFEVSVILKFNKYKLKRLSEHIANAGLSWNKQPYGYSFDNFASPYEAVIAKLDTLNGTLKFSPARL